MRRLVLIPHLAGRCHSTVSSAQNKSSEHFDFSNAKPFEEIPAAPSFPIIGSAWTFLPLVGKHRMDNLINESLDKYKTYGKIFRETTPFGYQIVSVFDPADIETMFRYEGRTPFRLAMEPMVAYRKMRKEIYGNGGLLVTQGEDWYQSRMKVQPHMLHTKTIRSYVSQMDVVASEMIEAVHRLRDENGEIPDFMNHIYKWALESIAIVALDTKIGCLDPNHPKDSEAQMMIDAVIYCFQSLLDHMLKPPLWKFFPTRQWKELVEVLDFLKYYANKYIDVAKERIKTTDIKDRELTILEALLNSKNFSIQDALTMVGDMMFAGIDTSSSASAFTLYHLAKNPEAQEKVYQEALKILPSKIDPVPESAFNNIPYLQACFKESLRLHPVVNGTIRKLDCDVLLSGYKVPAGTLIVSQNGTAGILAENFSDPLAFKPERWMRGTKEKFHPFASLPFGFGPRMCIGKRIAEQEIWLLLLKVIRNFKLEYWHEDFRIVSRIVNTPDKPVRIRFIPRKE